MTMRRQHAAGSGAWYHGHLKYKVTEGLILFPPITFFREMFVYPDGSKKRETFDCHQCRNMHVDEAKVTASFADGVLELTLPKMEKTSKRKVKVD